MIHILITQGNIYSMIICRNKSGPPVQIMQTRPDQTRLESNNNGLTIYLATWKGEKNWVRGWSEANLQTKPSDVL